MTVNNEDVQSPPKCQMPHGAMWHRRRNAAQRLSLLTQVMIPLWLAASNRLPTPSSSPPRSVSRHSQLYTLVRLVRRYHLHPPDGLARAPACFIEHNLDPTIVIPHRHHVWLDLGTEQPAAAATAAGRRPVWRRRHWVRSAAEYRYVWRWGCADDALTEAGFGQNTNTGGFGQQQNTTGGGLFGSNTTNTGTGFGGSCDCASCELC